MYAVLDGASVPELPQVLYREAVRSECLFRGKLEPDVAQTAPYLVELKPEAPFTDWLLSEGWGKHWGIFAVSQADFIKLRGHFRTFLMVYDPDNEPLYFRYYDPRVFRAYLPTCNKAETATLFGPVSYYLAESAESAKALRLSVEDELPKVEEVGLSAQ